MKRSLEEFEKSFNLAIGNMKHENMGEFTEKEKELLELKYMKKITEEEFIKRVIELCTCEDK